MTEEDYSVDDFDDYPDDFDEIIEHDNEKNDDVIHIITNESLDHDDNEDITNYLFDNDNDYDDESFEKETTTSQLTKLKSKIKTSNSNNQISGKKKLNNKLIKFNEEEIASLSDSDDSDFNATLNSVLQKGQSLKSNRELKNVSSTLLLEEKEKSKIEESSSKNLKNKEKIVLTNPIPSNNNIGNKSELQSLSSPITTLINKHNGSISTNSISNKIIEKLSTLENKNEIISTDKVIEKNIKYKIIYGGGIAIRKSPSKNSDKTDIVMKGNSIFEAISTLVVDSIKYVKVTDGWIPERIGDIIIFELVKIDKNDVNDKEKKYEITQVKDNTYNIPAKPSYSTESLNSTFTTTSNICTSKTTNEEIKNHNNINVIDTAQKLEDSTEELMNKLKNIHEKSLVSEPKFKYAITPDKNKSLPLKTEIIVESKFSFSDMVKENEIQSNKNDIIEGEFSFADMVNDNLVKSVNVSPLISKFPIVHEEIVSTYIKPVVKEEIDISIAPIIVNEEYMEDNFESLSPVKLNVDSIPSNIVDNIVDTKITKEISVQINNQYDNNTNINIKKNNESIIINIDNDQKESSSIPIIEPAKVISTESVTTIPQIIIKIDSLDNIGEFLKEKFPRGGIEIIVQANILGITQETKIIEYDNNVDKINWKDNNGVICWNIQKENLKFITSIYPKLILHIMYRKKSKGKIKQQFISLGNSFLDFNHISDEIQDISLPIEDIKKSEIKLRYKLKNNCNIKSLKQLQNIEKQESNNKNLNLSNINNLNEACSFLISISLDDFQNLTQICQSAKETMKLINNSTKSLATFWLSWSIADKSYQSEEFTASLRPRTIKKSSIVTCSMVDMISYSSNSSPLKIFLCTQGHVIAICEIPFALSFDNKDNLFPYTITGWYDLIKINSVAMGNTILPINPSINASLSISLKNIPRKTILSQPMQHGIDNNDVSISNSRLSPSRRGPDYKGGIQAASEVVKSTLLSQNEEIILMRLSLEAKERRINELQGINALNKELFIRPPSRSSSPAKRPLSPLPPVDQLILSNKNVTNSFKLREESNNNKSNLANNTNKTVKISEARHTIICASGVQVLIQRPKSASTSSMLRKLTVNRRSSAVSPGLYAILDLVRKKAQEAEDLLIEVDEMCRKRLETDLELALIKLKEKQELELLNLQKDYDQKGARPKLVEALKLNILDHKNIFSQRNTYNKYLITQEKFDYYSKHIDSQEIHQRSRYPAMKNNLITNHQFEIKRLKDALEIPMKQLDHKLDFQRECLHKAVIRADESLEHCVKLTEQAKGFELKKDITNRAVQSSIAANETMSRSLTIIAEQCKRIRKNYKLIFNNNINKKQKKSKENEEKVKNRPISASYLRPKSSSNDRFGDVDIIGSVMNQRVNAISTCIKPSNERIERTQIIISEVYKGNKKSKSRPKSAPIRSSSNYLINELIQNNSLNVDNKDNNDKKRPKSASEIRVSSHKLKETREVSKIEYDNNDEDYINTENIGDDNMIRPLSAPSVRNKAIDNDLTSNIAYNRPKSASELTNSTTTLGANINSSTDNLATAAERRVYIGKLYAENDFNALTQSIVSKLSTELTLITPLEKTSISDKKYSDNELKKEENGLYFFEDNKNQTSDDDDDDDDDEMNKIIKKYQSKDNNNITNIEELLIEKKKKFKKRSKRKKKTSKKQRYNLENFLSILENGI